MRDQLYSGHLFRNNANPARAPTGNVLQVLASVPPTKSLSLLFWRWAVLSIFFHIQLVDEFCNEWKFCQGWNLNWGRGDRCHKVPHKPACLQLTPKGTRQVAKFALWYNLSPSTFISKIQKDALSQHGKMTKEKKNVLLKISKRARQKFYSVCFEGSEFWEK